MTKGLKAFLFLILESLRDLAPIILVIAFFQLVVLQQPIPNLDRILVGLVLVLLGLTFFIQGLQMGLFPIGENMAGALTRKGSLFWLLAFAFLLGFGTTAEDGFLVPDAGLRSPPKPRRRRRKVGSWRLTPNRKRITPSASA